MERRTEKLKKGPYSHVTKHLFSVIRLETLRDYLQGSQERFQNYLTTSIKVDSRKEIACRRDKSSFNLRDQTTSLLPPFEEPFSLF
jgi:hypothetical protein